MVTPTVMMAATAAPAVMVAAPAAAHMAVSMAVAAPHLNHRVVLRRHRSHAEPASASVDANSATPMIRMRFMSFPPDRMIAIC